MPNDFIRRSERMTMRSGRETEDRERSDLDVVVEQMKPRARCGKCDGRELLCVRMVGHESTSEREKEGGTGERESERFSDKRIEVII